MRRRFLCLWRYRWRISIHAPIVGCDDQQRWYCIFKHRFQSTHPSWGATQKWPLNWLIQEISIHAPIVGCDHLSFKIYTYLTHISIHAPIVGCDLVHGKKLIAVMIFQSTHPSWGATYNYKKVLEKMIISIHAPIVGCDQANAKYEYVMGLISIHAPIVGCDETTTIEVARIF